MSRPARPRLSVSVSSPSRPPPPPAIEAAVAALGQGRPDLAERALLDDQVGARKDLPGMHILAIALAMQQRFSDAEALWRELLTFPDQEAQVLPNLGRMLEKAGRLQEAEQLLTRAVELSPQDHNAHLNLGACLHMQERYALARHHTEIASRLRPDLAQPHFNLGSIWQAEDQFHQARASYERALAIDPVHQGAIGNLLFLQHLMPEVTPQERCRSACALGDRLCQQITAMPPGRPRTPGPLRVGLLSADFLSHPVGWFLSGFLPRLDAQAVEVTAFNNAALRDGTTERLRAACAHWHDILPLGDDAAARLIADCGIDVLIDLSGMTAGHRLGVLARKPAPVQVNWLGYFGTNGLPTMDALLADPLCLPPGEEALYRERVWRLPHSRFCMAPPDHAPEVSALPALSTGQLTLGSFQALTKINDRVLALWASVLAALPQARLRLQAKRLSKPQAVAHLRERLATAGIAADRCELLPATTRATYLRAHHQVDFILDSFPYTGGTTTCEALWMGVPTLTLSSPGMLGRQGEAHLRNLGLDNWVAHSEAGFVELARRHAGPDGLQSLARLRSELRERCRVSPLFDNQRFAADWTQALQAMHTAFLSTLPQQP